MRICHAATFDDVIRTVCAFMCFVLIGLLSVEALPASAQRFTWPEKPKNIQALPSTISSRELSGTMRAFTRALGVRCSHCHVGEEGASLTTYDFESDDKAAKRTTREMIRMVQAINQTHLAGLETSQQMRVTCVTCHRGNSKPYMIEDILTNTLEEEGVESAVEKYLDIRKEYHGGFTYDLTERGLDRFATELLSSDKTDAAIAFFRVNSELYPESSDAWASLANSYAASGDTLRAVTLYQHALVLHPGNERVARALSSLK
jgi:tetratricopeptide (TPR) repeat protein